MNPDDIESTLRESLRLLIVGQWELATLDVGERTVTSHLFRYLANLLDGSALAVDHEYNRRFDLTKRLTFRTGDDLGEQRIFPDIIVHKRKDDELNILALEAKKGKNTNEDDRQKILALVTQAEYRYEVGVLLGLGMTPPHDHPGWQTETPYLAWAPSWEWLTSDRVVGGARSDGINGVFSDDELDSLNQEGWERFRNRSSF